MALSHVVPLSFPMFLVYSYTVNYLLKGKMPGKRHCLINGEICCTGVSKGWDTEWPFILELFYTATICWILTKHNCLCKHVLCPHIHYGHAHIWLKKPLDPTLLCWLTKHYQLLQFKGPDQIYVRTFWKVFSQRCHLFHWATMHVGIFRSSSCKVLLTR